MNVEIALGVLFVLASITMFALRIYYQSRVWQDYRDYMKRTGRHLPQVWSRYTNRERYDHEIK